MQSYGKKHNWQYVKHIKTAKLNIIKYFFKDKSLRIRKKYLTLHSQNRIASIFVLKQRQSSSKNGPIAQLVRASDS